MNTLVISKQTARRFVLGRQGLWPGRRWRGKRGTASALRACEAVQLDPLAVVARSQDIVLHSRVLDYKPRYLDERLYEERAFFDYGGWLAVYPMSELPYWQHHMERRSHEKRVEDFVFTQPGIFERVRAALRSRGPLGNRDVAGHGVDGNYRGGKDTSLAMFDMCLSGELMIHHRDRFDHIYDFRENIAPRAFNYAADPDEMEEFFACKCIAFKGLMPEGRWKTDLQYFVRHAIGRAEMRERTARWIAQGLAPACKSKARVRLFLCLARTWP